MRFLSLLTVTLFSVSAAATEIFPGFTDVRELPTKSPGYFEFIVGEGGKADGQAANYTDPDLEGLYDRLLKENSDFKKMVTGIYESNGCKTDGHYKDPQLGDSFCGVLNGLNRQNTVLWSYGRGGWAAAYQSRRSFLTWTGAGSGSYTDVVIQLTTIVNVEAIETQKPDAPPVYKVTIDMTNFTELKND